LVNVREKGKYLVKVGKSCRSNLAKVCESLRTKLVYFWSKFEIKSGKMWESKYLVTFARKIFLALLMLVRENFDDDHPHPTPPHPDNIKSDLVRGYEDWQEWNFDDFLKELKMWKDINPIEE
jgi:hypothetical protein